MNLEVPVDSLLGLEGSPVEVPEGILLAEVPGDILPEVPEDILVEVPGDSLLALAGIPAGDSPEGRDLGDSPEALDLEDSPDRDLVGNLGVPVGSPEVLDLVGNLAGDSAGILLEVPVGSLVEVPGDNLVEDNPAEDSLVVLDPGDTPGPEGNLGVLAESLRQVKACNDVGTPCW